MIGQFAAFSLVGVAAAIGHYGLYILLVAGGGMRPLPASVAGFLVGGIISYSLNYRFTFRSDKRHREATAKFLAVACVGLLLNSAIVGVLTGPPDVHYLAAQLIATACVLCWTFLANKFWTFRPQA